MDLRTLLADLGGMFDMMQVNKMPPRYLGRHTARHSGAMTLFAHPFLPDHDQKTRKCHIAVRMCLWIMVREEGVSVLRHLCHCAGW